MALTQIKTAGIADNAITDAKVADAITVAASGLSGDTLASGVTASSLTSVGTLSSLNVSGNAVISGSLQSDDITLDAGAGNPDLIIKTTASSSATAQALFLTGSHDFTLVNDTANFRLYNSTPGIGVDVIKVIGSSSDILLGDVSNSRHVSLDYSNGDFVVNKRLGVGAVPDSSYAGATIYGTSAFKTTSGDGSELRFKLYTGGAADASILQMFKADGSTIGVNLHSDGESYFKNSSHSVLTLEAGTNSSASLRLKNDAQHWDVNCQTTDNFALYDHTGGAAALIIESGGYNASFTGTIQSVQSATGDYANVAFQTSQSGNGGVKISHGGGNGKLELYGGNQSRTQFYANQITANVNGLEIKTTDAQSLTLGSNNTTRVTIDSSGNASFSEKILMTSESVIQQVADETKGFMFSGGGGTNFGYPNVQGSGMYGMVFGRESINESGGGHYIAKSHWGGISIIGFSGSGVQGIDIVAWGYGNGGATVLKSGNWVGSLYRSYSTVNYHLVVDVGTTVNMFSILIGI